MEYKDKLISDAGYKQADVACNLYIDLLLGNPDAIQLIKEMNIHDTTEVGLMKAAEILLRNFSAKIGAYSFLHPVDMLAIAYRQCNIDKRERYGIARAYLYIEQSIKQN